MEGIATSDAELFTIISDPIANLIFPISFSANVILAVYELFLELKKLPLQIANLHTESDLPEHCAPSHFLKVQLFK